MKLSFSCLIEMRTSAIYAIDFWLSEATHNTIGAMAEYTRYCRILTRIEKALWDYKAVNIEK